MSWVRRSVTGYVFVADVDEGPMRFAAAGRTISNEDGGPPWIVVDQSIESIVVAKWPGKLWRVSVLQKAAEQPAAYAKYTRAVAVEVIAEEPVSRLFGAHGDAVCRILERAQTITLDDVALLESAVSDEARAAYSRAWNRWLGDSHDHTATLAAGESRSPIGAGFTVLHQRIVDCARTLTNGAALTTSDDDELLLAPDWWAAGEACLHAAMAQGAPELLSPGDAELLTAAWKRLS